MKGLEARKQFYYSKARDYSQARKLFANVRDKGYLERIISEEQEKIRKEQEEIIHKKLKK